MIIYYHCKNDFPLPKFAKMSGLCYTITVQNLFWDGLSVQLVFGVSIEGSVDMKAVASLAAVTLFLRGRVKGAAGLVSRTLAQRE